MCFGRPLHSFCMIFLQRVETIYHERPKQCDQKRIEMKEKINNEN